MPHSCTQDQRVTQLTIDRDVLISRGWVSFDLLATAESDLRTQMFELAIGLGAPVATRSGGSICDTLLPTEAKAANPRSLSRVHAFGEFPLHIDTAHWLTPCRYVMLACISPGIACRPTLLMDTRRLLLKEHQSLLLHSAPLRVTNGRNSFFSTILSKSRPFVRFDTGCMTATTTDGVKALAVLTKENCSDHVETIQWKSGMVLVIDNWRMLHGRSQADCPDPNRRLLRISIQ